MTHNQKLKAAFELIHDATEKYLREDISYRQYQTVVTATHNMLAILAALVLNQKAKASSKARSKTEPLR